MRYNWFILPLITEVLHADWSSKGAIKPPGEYALVRKSILLKSFSFLEDYDAKEWFLEK